MEYYGFGDSPLITAIVYGDIAEAEKWIQKGEFINVSNGGGTPLKYAIGDGHYDLAKRLLKAGAKVNVQDDEGVTALMRAADKGCFEMVQELLKVDDIDVNLQDRYGNSALMHATQRAVQCGGSEIVKALLNAGADDKKINMA